MIGQFEFLVCAIRGLIGFRRENDMDNSRFDDRWEPRLCRFMKGNALAELKVQMLNDFLKNQFNSFIFK